MKVNFSFDKESRSIHLQAEDPLEEAVLKEMSERCEKGSQLRLSSVTTTSLDLGKPKSGTFVVELRVNGH